MINSYIVYLDMDGVLADFDRAFIDRFGVDPNDMPKDEKWEKIKEYNDTVEDWFLSLEMMPDAGELLKFVTANFTHVQILTASGTTLEDAPYQKRTWIDDNVGSIRVNVVKKGKDKAVYANSYVPAIDDDYKFQKAILIDDREKTIKPFVAAGGKAILHTSAANTIKTLKVMMEDWD
jgi:5'-nucleotidase